MDVVTLGSMVSEKTFEHHVSAGNSARAVTSL